MAEASKLSPAAYLELVRKRVSDTPPPIERVVSGGRVLFFPAAEGTVRIVGVGPRDEWLAEFSCLEADFREDFLRRMERHIARKTGARIAVVS